MPDGTCALCGRFGKLTKEHVPPSSAFNKHPILMTTINHAVTHATGEVKWEISGAEKDGRFIVALCDKCNNRTGSWYGTDYARFAKAIAESRIPPGESGVITFVGRPAAIAKQALVSLCATCGPRLTRGFDEVRRLVLKNHAQGRPGDCRLWVYARADKGGHQTGRATGLDVEAGSITVVAEFSHWPLGWALTWEDRSIPDLAEVTSWLEMQYDIPKTITLSLSCKYKPTAYPLDYRSPEEFEIERRQNSAIRNELTTGTE